MRSWPIDILERAKMKVLKSHKAVSNAYTYCVGGEIYKNEITS